MNFKQSEEGIALPLVMVAFALVVFLLGFTVFRTLTSNDTASRMDSDTQARDVSELLPTSLNDVLSIEEIKDKAVQGTDATVTGLELENEDGVLVYEVRLSNGTVLAFDATTGAAIPGFVSDDTTEDDEALPANFTVSISPEEARKTAQAKFPDSTVEKIELDVEAGVVVLSVRFTNDARVDVNAKTGAIVRTKSPDESSRSDTDQSTDDDSSSSGSSSDDDSSDSNSGSGSNDDDDSGNSNSGSGSGETRVEGMLRLASGTYTVTENGTTYTIQTSQDISGWVGEPVRVEGILQSGNVIKAEEVDLR